VVSWISQGAAGLATGSREVVGYPGDGTGATEVGAAGCLWMSRDSWVGSGSRGMSLDVTGQPGRERKASGRCEVPRGLRDIMVCRMMSRDVAGCR